MATAQQHGNSSAPPRDPAFPWAWTAATVLVITLGVLVQHAMLARALMPAQSGYLLMLVVLGTAACWLLLQLGWRLLRRSNPALWFLLLALLPSVVGGWLVVRGAWAWVEAEEVRIAQRDLAGLTTALSSGAEDWGRAIPDPAPRGLAIWRDGREYLISVEAGSIDIDGSTLYLDSTLGDWRRFYDGSEGEDAKRFEERASSLPKVWPKPKEP